MANDIDGELEFMASMLEPLRHEYHWAHRVGYQRTNSQDTKVRSSGIQDPTGETVVSRYHAAARGNVKRAEKRIRQARMMLLDAQTALQSVLKEGDYVESADEEPFSTRIITPDEYEEAKAYQEKREARGDSFGEG